MTWNGILVEWQGRSLLCRDNYWYPAAQCIAKFDKAIWSQSRDINNRQFAIVQSLEDFDVDESVFCGVIAHFESAVADFLNQGIDHFSEETLNRSKFMHLIIQKSHIES